jgi:hypothetical protein
MHGQFACSGHGVSRFGLIWIPDLLNIVQVLMTGDDIRFLYEYDRWVNPGC